MGEVGHRVLCRALFNYLPGSSKMKCPSSNVYSYPHKIQSKELLAKCPHIDCFLLVGAVNQVTLRSYGEDLITARCWSNATSFDLVWYLFISKKSHRFNLYLEFLFQYFLSSIGKPFKKAWICHNDSTILPKDAFLWLISRFSYTLLNCIDLNHYRITKKSFELVSRQRRNIYI